MPGEEPGIQVQAYAVPAEIKGRMEIMLQSIRSGVPPKTACNIAGIAWKDMEWLYKHHPETRDLIHRAQGEVVQKHLENIALASQPRKVQKTIVTTGSKGTTSTEIEEEVSDWKASAWLLERIDRENFGVNTQPIANVTVDIGTMIKQTAAALIQAGAKVNVVTETIPDADFEEYVEEEEK